MDREEVLELGSGLAQGLHEGQGNTEETEEARPGNMEDTGSGHPGSHVEEARLVTWVNGAAKSSEVRMKNWSLGFPPCRLLVTVPLVVTV